MVYSSLNAYDAFLQTKKPHHQANKNEQSCRAIFTNMYFTPKNSIVKVYHPSFFFFFSFFFDTPCLLTNWARVSIRPIHKYPSRESNPPTMAFALSTSMLSLGIVSGYLRPKELRNRDSRTQINWVQTRYPNRQDYYGSEHLPPQIRNS